MITGFKETYEEALKHYYFVGGMPEVVQSFADNQDFNEARKIQKRIHQKTLLDGNDLLIEFKGALTEQYVCQQLKIIEDLGIYYYTNDRGSCEVDFVIDTGEQIIPVEVKAEVNLKAKSLKTYKEKYAPEISVRTSMAPYKPYKKEEWLVNLPLYAVEQITEL